ncbi:fimbria/pilus outer membrane usher protein [Shewanella sp. NIFS-20-20]|uniref:fimbria/pilus outer membrane usher protein n=1 Tax=Shewanella sp. NIFS-20-20 TaxID=2853806 RepID=UPI001C4979F0|nr:fimbria/pilus outer membrane usher protein [Shewanella sp. NIFS-20-20]MBV7315414.1 fimbria/pilus outer membrane usher protein [Shewanella sp. NIFS-20-20]
MKGGMWLSIIFALLVSPLPLMAMTMSLPLWSGDRELGDVAVTLQGMDIGAVSLPALQAQLGGRVAASTWQALAANPQTQGMVSVSTLAQAGISVTLDSQTLSLSVVIATHAMGEIGVDFAEDYIPFVPSASSDFSWLNSFNFAHTQNWQGDEQSQNSAIDWLAQFNIGGASGLNITTANYLELDEGQSQFLRGEWTAFYDNPHLPMRLSLGDVTSGTSGFLSSLNIGGFSLESDYAKLQPNRVIGPNNQQILILQESADIDIAVNGQIIYSGRQEAGRFNLANLPMNNGANDIVVYVRYLSGKTETLTFSQFYNSTLLQQGIVNYSLSAGVPSIYGDDGIAYLSTWAANGFVEYGWTSWLTIGVNATAAKYGQGLGSTATIGTDVGNLSLRASLSNTDSFGSIYAVNFESTVVGASPSQTPNLRLAFEYADNFMGMPWEDEAYGLSYQRMLFNYVWTINGQWDANVSGAYYHTPDGEKQLNSTAILNWRSGNINLGAGMSYGENSEFPQGDWQYFLTFDWHWANAERGYNLGTSYNTEANRSRLDFSRLNNDRVGDMGMRALVEYEDQRDRQLAQVSYSGNRGRWEAVAERTQFNDSDPRYSASIRANTAIGLAGSHVGWGRAQPGPFLVAELHPTLAESELQLEVNQSGEYTAAADGTLNGLLPLDVAYSINNIDINVPDAPLGYDWGDSRLTISPGAATGHVAVIGSDSSYTAMGILRNHEGEPLAYLQGEIDNSGQGLAFFTNKQGRFYIAGVSPGEYEMRLAQPGCQPMSVTIEAKASSLIDMGILSMTCTKEDNHERP